MLIRLLLPPWRPDAEPLLPPPAHGKSLTVRDFAAFARAYADAYYTRLLYGKP